MSEPLPPTVPEAAAPPPKFSLSYDPQRPPGLARPEEETTSSTALAFAIIAGLAAAGIGGSVWAYIAISTGYEIGYLAMGIGLLGGFAVRLAGARGDTARLLAVISVVLGLLLAKVLIVDGLISTGVGADEFVKDDNAMVVPVLYEMAKTGEVPKEVGERVVSINLATLTNSQADALGRSLQEYGPAVLDRIARLTPEDRKTLAQNFVKDNFSRLGYWDRVKAASSFLDIVWFFLAVTIAFRVAGGDESSD